MRPLFMAAALGAGLAGALSGAGAAQAPAPAPSAAQLMALAFPGWGEAAASRVQAVTLTSNPRRPNWGNGRVAVVAEPRLVMQTDASHLVLVAGLVPAAEDGKPALSQLTPMALAAYQFEKRGNSWQVSGRQGIFAWRGFSGAASVRAVALSAQRQGIAVEYGSCWDGYCGTWMALYELDKEQVRHEPAVELALSGTNADSMADCAHRLQGPGRRQQELPAAPDSAGGESYDCYAIESSWSIEPSRQLPGDLVIHYQGAMSRAAAPTLGPAAIDQRQVLRYGSGKYRAVSGFNPVPPI